MSLRRFASDLIRLQRIKESLFLPWNQSFLSCYLDQSGNLHFGRGDGGERAHSTVTRTGRGPSGISSSSLTFDGSFGALDSSFRNASAQQAGATPGILVAGSWGGRRQVSSEGVGTRSSYGDEASKAFHATARDKVSEKAAITFEGCWRRLEDKYRDRMICPKEIVWLNGAPGSGKGANTPFILESRGLTRAVSMSSLLEHNQSIKELMEAGELVPDAMVGDALLEVIFNPDQADSAGILIDGFPRTALQVDFLKLLHDRLMELHLKHADTPDEWRFPRPSFKVVVLYVEQEESVRRQMMRAKLAAMHNTRVMDAGTGDLWELRATDVDAAKCRRRYEVFKAHYNTLLRLKQYFPFSLIDAMGTLDECKAQITRELRYQSSLDLDEGTYAAIRHLPLAKDLVRISRQQLVSHLDLYCKRHNKTFMKVIELINTEAVPLLRRCSLAGHAELKTHNPLFTQVPLAADMFIDILSDRGFNVAYDINELIVPLAVDITTGVIHNKVEQVHHFRITFDKGGVRETASPAIAAVHASEAAEKARQMAIGQTHMPLHLDREAYSGHITLARLSNEAARLAASETLKDSQEDGRAGSPLEAVRSMSEAALQASTSNGRQPAVAGEGGKAPPKLPSGEELAHLAAHGEVEAAPSRTAHSAHQEAWDTHFVGRSHDSFGSGADALPNVAFPSWAGASPRDAEEALHPVDMLAQHAQRIKEAEQHAQRTRPAKELENADGPSVTSSGS
eukprot:jgi/Botrbrau1/5455/Bobra.27_1s0006.1